MDVRADTTKIFLVTANLHFIQHEFCPHHWVHLFSITGEFTFRKECISCLFRFYDEKSAPFRFYDYQGRQRSNAEMANILISGGKKYNKTKQNRKQRKKKRKKKQENNQT
ncbi:hypothetical protein BCV72DRAFT_310753 [Rhizopus microsporus var. microsporus]|uniref:Uncharacterized protein n=1 Tax=Rhizopus microsporus var. microsporus TaxID=86635 RepID=A0A1X0QLQ4_RHIZD|nr:hypothetical protein BCV72DRAFT_310753 [Rhizopus microsporus var. microsporus]